tara:strand:- start:4 stop:834 length:831 start_codon:yes stop_codon:yes gene_type:complete
MLGLGNSLVTGVVSQATFDPTSIAIPDLWLKYASGINALHDTNGDAVSHNTYSALNMADGDKLNQWLGSGPTVNNLAFQSTEADKPRWEADAAHIGGAYYPSGKFFNLNSTITVAANTDFTVVCRFFPDTTSGNALIGSSATEHFRIHTNAKFRLRADDGGGTAYNTDFTSGTVMTTDKYLTVILVRSDGSTGNVNIFVRGADSGYFDGTAAGTAWGAQAQVTEELVFDNIGSAADDGSNFRGYIKDFIVYDGTAVTEAQREQLFDYIEGQEVYSQ